MIMIMLLLLLLLLLMSLLFRHGACRWYMLCAVGRMVS
jgi:hypothetical protein